jgi:D-xylose transport system permease protein
MAAALGVGAAVGLFNGLAITRLGVHSLVVTLAGLLGFQGAQLYVLGDTGTINLTDPTLIGLAGTFLPPTLGWGLAALALLAYGSSVFYGRRRRKAAGLGPGSVSGPRRVSGRWPSPWSRGWRF